MGSECAQVGVTLTHARSRAVIAHDVLITPPHAARRHTLRRCGIVAPGGALVLAPCVAVSTAFMPAAIDLAFVDRGGYVRRTLRGLRPWRIATFTSAFAAIELPAGSLDAHDVVVGDRLCLGARLSMQLSG